MTSKEKIYFFALCLPKSILFNLKYLPFSQAIKLPIFISNHVCLKRLSGVVKIYNTKTGAVKIGFGNIGIFDKKFSRTIWEVSGKVEFKGNANIGHGSKISVEGDLIIGDNFQITAESSIVCQKAITIGNDVLISWDCLIMDTDYHNIYDSRKTKLINPPREIAIGNKVWIGCRSLILKGSTIADGVIVAAGSIVTKSFAQRNSIIGGNPTRIIKNDIIWE